MRPTIDAVLNRFEHVHALLVGTTPNHGRMQRLYSNDMDHLHDGHSRHTSLRFMLE